MQWIRVADPDAGRVDDLQIGRPNRVDAYQVKWAQYGGNFSFNNLVSTPDDAPALIAQLADGWKLLRRIHPSRRVVVHLVTNETPSVSDRRIPAGTPPPASKHFAAFLEQAWMPAHSSPDTVSPPETWEQAWKTLRYASGLSETEFTDFVLDCKLEFGYQIPDADAADDREGVAFQRDLWHISRSLFDVVAEAQQVVQLDRDQLLVRLGWAERFEPRNIHEFPVDEVLYRPVGATVRQLREMIDDLPGGYVGVFGTPGSGKSTMLTQTLRFHPTRVVRYYAFVPDDRGPTVLRGESTNFLHDVTIALSDAGFAVGRNPNPTDRAQLLGRFHEQLRLLGKDYRRDGRKTLILVDGLDHIEREQHPDRSLLWDLPAPEQVPEGVYIVLGSQTDAPFPSGVQYEIRRPERRVEMGSLSRESVVEIVARSGLSLYLNEEQRERVHYLSDGHPLALMYLLGRLQNRASAEGADAVLEDTMRYEGSIERQYHGYWKQIENNHRMVNLLGLLARFRNVIDMRWVESWEDRSLAGALRLTMAHYFRVEDRHRWYFFHNSFRLFLLHKTGEIFPDGFDDSLDRDYHRQLAERCAREPEGSYQAWEELYHRFMSGENDKVLELATQELFREQFRSFRPARAVKEDIRLSLRSAAALQKVISIPRLAISGHELEQRGYYLEPSALAELLLQVGEGQVASEHLRDGRLLLVDKDEGLRLSIILRSAGYAEEGQRLFELAEPLDILAEGSSIKDELEREKWSLLESWSKAAAYFLSTDELVGAASRVTVESAGAEWLTAEEATRLLRSRMLLGAGIELLKQRQWEDLSKVSEALHEEAAEGLLWWFRLNARTWRERERAGDPHTARWFLEHTVEEADSIHLDPEARVVIAEGLFRISGDSKRARRFLSDVPQPELATWTSYSNAGLKPFLQRFRLNRLLFALGDQHLREDEIVPDAKDPRDQAVTYIERALCRLARLWGSAWRGVEIDASVLERDIRPLLRLPLWRNRSAWSSSARLLVGPEARSDLYSLAVDTAAQHSLQAVKRLREAFENEWDGNAGVYWSNSVRREVILALWRAGTSMDWTLSRLRELEGRTTDDNDVSSRIDEYRERVEALLELDKGELARSTLRGMLSVSLGVGYEKDYQLDTWIRWLGRVNIVEPDGCAKRIAWFSQIILALKEESTTHSDAANELLEVCFQWSPRRAVDLLWWFSERGVVQHEGAVRVLLRAALDSEDPPTDAVARCLGEIVIPIANRADTELTNLTVERTARYRGKEKAVEVARTLSRKIGTYACPSERSGWLFGVTQALERMGVDPVQEAGLTLEDLRRESEDGYSSTLELNDEPEPLSAEEIERRASSPSGLRGLLEQHRSNSYYPWERLLEPLVPSLGAGQVDELANLLRDKHHGSLALSMLSKRLHDLNNLEWAWSLGQQALETSDALLGWRRWGDGGSRLTSLGALVRIDADRAYPLALLTLVGDLADGHLDFQSIALNLEEILPLMTGDTPVLETWCEVEPYLRALLEGSMLPPDRPECLNENSPNDTARTAISDLITSHLDHPVNVLSHAALRACGDWLLKGNDGIEGAVRRLLEGSEANQERASMILNAASLREPRAAAPFREELRELLTSPNYAVRETAHIVHKRLGLQHSPPTSSELLPAIYRLSLPPSDFRLYAPSAEVSETEALPDAWGSVELVRPFDVQLGFIAEEAKIPEENACYRAAQIMRQRVTAAQLTAQHEAAFRANLSEVGLRFPNRRQRATLARRAMSTVVAELVDAGRLRAGNLLRLEAVLRFYDPFMLLVDPASRPEYVPPVSEDERGADGNKAWVERVEDAFDLAARKTCDGRIVLAEETTFKKLDWGGPTEDRLSTVLPLSQTSRSTGDRDALFHKVVNGLYTEYPNSVSPSYNDRLVVRHSEYGYESPGEHWLALNPSIGKQLGWNPTDSGLFGWADDGGKTMVESVLWADGLLARTYPLGNYAVGEGWLVLATKEAINQIKEVHGELARILVTERSWTNEAREVLSASISRKEAL